MRSPKQLIVVFIALLVAGGCYSTQLATSWKAPDAQPIAFKKVVVLVLNTTPGDRRAQEDELSSQIKKAVAIPAYTIIPDGDLADREKVKAKIIASGADGAVVVRILEDREEATYIPAATSYWDASGGFAPYHYGAGQVVTNTVVRSEVSLYTVPQGKMLWAGASTTYDPSNPKDFALQTARAATAELKKQGLLK